MKAKKLPSGSWRCQVYSHSEPVVDANGNPVMDKNGKPKVKRIYESFTCDDKSPRGKREAERMAAEFAATKDQVNLHRQRQYDNMTLSEAIDKYIESCITLRRSPTTIQDYRCIQKNGFQDLMDFKLKDLDERILQDAVNAEARRPSRVRTKNPKPISAKRIKNEWALLTAVLGVYQENLNLKKIKLPKPQERIVHLPPAQDVLRIIRGTDMELPVLLAAWLSFSMSEIRGLTKSKSIHGDTITIMEVVVNVDGRPVRKEDAKEITRKRTHRIPPYIMKLIDQVEGDVLVPMGKRQLYYRWIKLLDDNHMEHITFHDLRHLNASIMALLKIPDKYAQERGGWASDHVMKKIYMQTFSDERIRVDNLVDQYFEELMQHEMQHEKEKAL